MAERSAAGSRSSSVARLLLLGLPGAGKTALLSALARCTKALDPPVDGSVRSLSPEFEELGRLAHEDFTPTAGEMVPFSCTYEPVPQPDSEDADPVVEAVFIDSNGEGTRELLAPERASADRHGLNDAIRTADALIIAVDGSILNDRLHGQISEFARFLQELQDERGARAEVSGLPVFIVLTKCDLLATPEDTAASWRARIEDRRQQAAQVLRASLQRPVVRAFGALDIQVLAAASKPPAISGLENCALGAAELLRRALKGATAFQRRRQSAGARLIWTVLGTLAAIAAMMVLGAIFVLRAPLSRSALEEHILAYRSDEGSTAAERLSDPVSDKIARLTAFQRDPGFARLPPPLKEYVGGRLQELQDYSSYRKRLRKIRIADIRHESGLQELDEELGSGLALPAPYGDEWRQTAAGKLHDQLAADVRSLREAVAATADWYRGLARQAERLRTLPKERPGDVSSWQQWQSQVESLLDKSPALELAGMKEESAAIVLGMDSVIAARSNWEALRPKLERLRDLVAALGLAGELPGHVRQPLDIPAGFRAEQAAAYRQRLEQLYPRLLKEIALIELPEATVADLLRVLRSRYQRLIEAGQSVVLGKLQQFEPEQKETLAGWREVRAWLETAAAPPDWRVLATLLGRLLKLPDPDPVRALASFISKDHFRVRCQSLILSVPSVLRLTPAGPLTIHFQAQNEPATSYVFNAADERASQPAHATSVADRYRFTSPAGVDISYRPGDQLWATLPVKRAGVAGDWLLTWSMCRSAIYQFERLIRWPRLHRVDQPNLEGTIAEGVLLSITPPDGVPAVPDLLPIVKFPSR